MNKSQKTLDQLHEEIVEFTHYTSDYKDRMIHDVPDTEVIDRGTFILTECIDKTVLDIGCVGPLHEKMKEVVTKVYGIDRVRIDGDPNFYLMQIGKDPIPTFPDIELIICGEIIEHLPNPGQFLEELKLKYPDQKKIFSVPNAFAIGHAGWTRKMKENVNKEHVAYYSYITFSNLLSIYDYKIEKFYWYDEPSKIQQQGFNEGLVFVTK